VRELVALEVLQGDARTAMRTRTQGVGGRAVVGKVRVAVLPQLHNGERVAADGTGALLLLLLLVLRREVDKLRRGAGCHLSPITQRDLALAALR
jgi:hypothetical protein